MENVYQQLEGSDLCLAHYSLVTGDEGFCERVEGDLPPREGNAADCGPFFDVFYLPEEGRIE